MGPFAAPAQAFAAGIASKRGFQRDLAEWGRGLRDGESGRGYWPPCDLELIHAYAHGHRNGCFINWVLAGAEAHEPEYRH
jgi:hypothetical protein